jgi:hypothetical protein
MKRLDSERTYESSSELERCDTMVQRAASRMESICGRVSARRPSPCGSVKNDGSENVISSRFSKPSKPIGEGGGASWLRMVIVQGSNGKDRATERVCVFFLGFVYSHKENFQIIVIRIENKNGRREIIE